MKVLVSTSETQGKRKNDFCFVPEGELVTFGLSCDGESVDGACGCQRSLVGFTEKRATTTFKVAECPEISKAEHLAARVQQFWVECGFWKRDELKECAELALKEAEILLHLAAGFPEGTILERRGNYLRRRQAAGDAQ